MKRIYLFLYLVLLSIGARAQTATAYGFTAFSSLYSSISATGTVSTSIGIDDITQVGIPLGFTFTFCGVNYNTVSACSNGWLSLANSPSTEYNNFATLIPGAGFLMPYWDDLSGQVTTSSPPLPVYYQTTGVAPNRIFTFEWKNWVPYFYTGSLGTGSGNFQIKLYETTNIIDFCYGPATFGSMQATIGIANSMTDWQTLNNVSAAPLPSSTTFTNLLSTAPATNQVYRWAICMPPPIMGTTNICIGTSTTLTDSVTGGTWVSGNTGVATIGSSSGLLAGVAAGTATISYTSTPGCMRTTVVTVNAAPGAITGSLSVCAGSAATLASSTSGGTWASSNAAVAVIGASTGIVTAVGAGTSTITYTSATTGCFTTATVTVNTLPAIITGTLTVCIGSTTTLASATTGGVWTSSAAGIASVVSGTGVVTGITAGTATISYTASGCVRIAAVTVNSAPAAIGGTATLCVGATTTLTNAATGGTWSSSATGVATVGAATGVVSGVSPGMATITYSLGSGCAVTRVVTVNALPGSITGTLAVCTGNTTSLGSATGGGTWTSGATGIATIGAATGIVSGITAGVATITYTAGSGCFITAAVTVNPLPGAISGLSTVCIGSTVTYSSTSTGGTWLSSNTAVATVSAAGVVTGIATGTANITYTLATGCMTVKPVTVNANPAAITGTGVVCAGLTTTLANATTGGTWSSSATGIAGVSSGTGVVTGVSAGTATITYTITATGCFTTTVVTVNPLPAAISGTASVCLGATTTLTDATTGGTWSSSASGTASISSAGVVAGVAVGTAIITYTLPTGCLRTVVATVSPLPATITGLTLMCQGSTSTFTDATAGGTWSSSTTAVATIGVTSGVVTGVSAGTSVISYILPTGCSTTIIMTVNPTVPSTGIAALCAGATTTLSNTLAGTWSSGNVAVATVGAGTGIVTGISAGTAAITYTFTSGCTTTTLVTVNPLPAAIGGTATVCIGQTTTLTNTSAGGTWVSGSTGIATIGAASGVVTGVTAGTSGITYTITATGCAITGTVTVNPLPLAITGPTAVCEGSAMTLSNATTGGTWSSSSAATATIGAATGVVAGIAAGAVTITYTAAVTGCYVTATITVNPLPAAIAGPGTVCIGATSTLTSTSGGGTWASSNTSVATIAAATGVASGITAGTATITYTLPTGCIITRTITVNPLPAVITGNIPFCQASAITLANASAGGTWSSGSTAVATIVASSGVVTGVSGGTSIITYTLPTGCIATAIATVNPLPAAISGTASVCEGLAITLSNTSGGGTWASSNTAIATITTATGIVSGIAPGTANITYTLPTGCVRTRIVTVNPLPSSITGTAAVCAGLTTTLANSTAGGTWVSSNTAVATIGLFSGVVTGVAGGTATITYSVTATGCIATATVTVNPLPAAISGSGGVCIGTSVTLTSATAGGTWSSSNAAVAAVAATTGVVSGITLGTATITYRLTTTGCEVVRGITVNPLPAAITGPATVCAAGGTITLSSASAGGTWTSSNTSIATAGLATGIITGVTAGTATITYTLPTSCIITRSVSVNPAPPAIITPLGDTTVCPGDFVVLTANTGASLIYQWYRDGVAITGAAISTYVAGISGSYQVRVSNTLGCPATSVPMLVTIDTPAAFIAAPGGYTGCVGGSVTLDATAGAGFSYQWLLDGTPIAGATDAVHAATVSGTYTVIVTNSTGCSASDYATVTIDPLPAAIVFISGSLTVCQGAAVTMTAAFAGGSTYQWHNTAGPIAGATSNVFSASVAGAYWVVETTAAGCSASSVTNTVVVNPLPVVGISLSGSKVFCSGGNVTLSAAAGAYTYQWYKGGLPVAGATNATHVASAAGGYRVRVTNSATGCTDITHADTVVTVVNTPLTILPLTPATFCWGGSAMLATSVPAAATTATYQWYRNGVIIPGATAANYNATTAGNYTAVVSIPGSCTATTLTMPVVEKPLPNPVITYNVTTHMLSAQSYFVSYQWYKDAVLIPGAISATTVSTGFANYKVAVTDTNGCQSFSAAFPLTSETGGGGSGGGSHVGVSATAGGYEVKIYPNPATSMVHIEAENPVSVVITSLDGRVVLQPGVTAKDTEIDISMLAGGIYMVTALGEDGRVVKVEKLVVSAR
ncbi:MAG: Ig-like domain-containing protein [Bacteroidota bacterium]